MFHLFMHLFIDKKKLLLYLQFFYLIDKFITILYFLNYLFLFIISHQNQIIEL